jgi:nucleoside-diphosphate-sugar epimerase
MERKIIIFGATGNTGLKICERLSKLNINHSAFVRKGSEGKISTTLTEVIQGDVLQKDTIEKAFTNQQFTDVIIALGSRDMKVKNIRSNGTKNIVDALNKCNLNSKLHVISAHGVGDSWDRLKWYEKLVSNVFLGKTMTDHGLQEEYVMANNPGGYHIVRPVALKNGPESGKINEQTGGQLPNGDITRADVAKYIIDGMLSNKKGANSICKG